MKNFKLLLASTAILSTGLAINVKAENDPSIATFDATIGIVVKDTLTPGSINFGVITTDKQGGGEGPIVLKVNPDGSVDESSTAERLAEPSVVAMKIHGAMEENVYDTLQQYVSMGKEAFVSVNSGTNPTEESIEEASRGYDMYQAMITSGISAEEFGGSDIKIIYEKNLNMLDADGNSCGTALLTSPLYKITDELGGTAEVRIGGTFTLNSDYKPGATDVNSGGGISYCSASTTVTKIGSWFD